MIEDGLPNKRARMTECHPAEQLVQMAKRYECKVTDKEFAAKLDENDPIGSFRGKFHIPKMKELPFSKYNNVFM